MAWNARAAAIDMHSGLDVSERTETVRAYLAGQLETVKP